MIKVVALIGKAGSGKDTILHGIIDDNRFHEIVSCTSRPPREGEINGFNYNFLSKEEFMKLVDEGKMLEWTEFNGWCYGTQLSSLVEDKINIGVFNIAGVKALAANKDIDLKVYYIHASDKERLLRQLHREQKPNVKEIVRRFMTDETDFMDINDIDYTMLVNQEQVDAYACAVVITGQNS